ncbi:NAD(P)H-flavin reductase [Arsenophonus symbiont of Ornithomya chloropus]|uniref:NAD(P)H-flavin reductase n=1 Tax=Arsenophonus symbiont of Ornithomya chloropus TaxID=634121 RepID=UPI0032B22C66
MTKLKCKVVSIKSINNTVYRVLLLPQGQFSFLAGQYLMLIIDEYNQRPFSIASIPSEKKTIELHISASRFHLYGIEVMKIIYKKNSINIDIPYGKAWFREGSKKPMIIITGGTGFSYTQSILHAALKENPNREITFYWGSRQLENLYYLNELKYLSKKYANLNIIFVIEEYISHWTGRRGTVLNAVLNDFNKLTQYEIYIAGSFKMAKTTRECLCNERGAIAKYCYGDAFESFLITSETNQSI